MTDFQKVFDAFLGKIEEDEWMAWEESDMREDWISLLKAAIPWFKFPRTPLSYDEYEEVFTEDLSNEEI